MENFLDSLRKNWIFITLIASIIIWSANLTTRIETAEAEILELKSINKEYLNTLQQIQGGFNLPSGITSVGGYFLYLCWQNCTNLKADAYTEDIAFEFNANNVFG